MPNMIFKSIGSPPRPIVFSLIYFNGFGMSHRDANIFFGLKLYKHCIFYYPICLTWHFKSIGSPPRPFVFPIIYLNGLWMSHRDTNLTLMKIAFIFAMWPHKWNQICFYMQSYCPTTLRNHCANGNKVFMGEVYFLVKNVTVWHW